MFTFLSTNAYTFLGHTIVGVVQISSPIKTQVKEIALTTLLAIVTQTWL